MALLEEEADINQLTEYFSYEHFYVIYCKFWELDTDHDLYIDRKDLARHNDHGMTNEASFFTCVKLLASFQLNKWLTAKASVQESVPVADPPCSGE